MDQLHPNQNKIKVDKKLFVWIEMFLGFVSSPVVVVARLRACLL